MAVTTKDQALALVAAIFVRAERRMAAKDLDIPESARLSARPESASPDESAKDGAILEGRAVSK